jgi:hypothetical protein
MRAVLVHVTEQELAHRRSTGLDRYDEMWEGVLHMTPAPSLEHQRILTRMAAFLYRQTNFGSVRLQADFRGGGAAAAAAAAAVL